MQKKELLYEGKAKKVFTTDNPDVLMVSYKDDATAFNGIKKGTILGKGAINNKMTNSIFKMLEEKGIPTHYVEEINDRETYVKKVDIVPLEVIIRNVAAGSFSEKLGIEEGSKLIEPTLEFSYKNDDLGDPLINDYYAIAIGAATREEIDAITELVFKINDALVEFFKERKIDLIDFKVEFGRYKGQIILADEISPDTCRLWDSETHDKLDKDRFRRDLGNVEDAYNEVSNRLGLTNKHNSDDDGLHEECGVFGIYDFDGNDVSRTIYYGLFALQHRGQESCGIAVSDTEGPKGKVSSCKGMGLVNEVFTEEEVDNLHGNIGVGHVRYSTAGASTRENAQPLVLNYVKGALALSHNGNLVNAPELRRELEHDGAIFQTTIDSEVIAYHIARQRVKTKSVEEAVINALAKVKGSYSLVIMSPRKLIGARDPFGFKPLCIGKRDNAYILASESCALDTVGAEFVRDVEPGEVVVITPEKGVESYRNLCQEKRGGCIFEYIYFARPDSVIDGMSVYDSRIAAGRCLAKDSYVEADLVVGVPESGNIAALGYSLESGIPYGTAFVKNSYVGRTFIKPSQTQRESSVRVKLNALSEAVKGKRVIMIDDSIVRGTTSDRIVEMLKDAGATEVHVRISSPPFLHPCYFGTDVPDSDQLIAHNRSVEEISKIIGADSLAYLSIDRLGELTGGKQYCHGCFTGTWPMNPPVEDIRGEYDNH